jgi:acetyl esterase
MDAQLDPQAQALLEQMASAGSVSDRVSPEAKLIAARESHRAVIPLAGEPEPVRNVYERQIPTESGRIPVRIYAPNADQAPVLIYFHGGSFMSGDLDTHDTPLRALANKVGCIIVAVAYRLAPEHPFPAAPEDCYTVTKWVAENADEIGADKTRLAVGGDSAGGDLATVVCLMARDRGSPAIMYQVLLYPDTDLTESSASWMEFADRNKPIITREGKLAAITMYVPQGVDVKHPYVSPLYAQVSQLPPAFIVTGEFDPQRDEGEAYAARLEQAGIPVVSKRYKGMIHGFFQMAGVLDAGKELIAETAAVLKDAFAK